MKTCVLVLDNIRSVENTGSIFRTAECLGVSKIYLIGTTPTPLDRFGRKRSDFAKVALGAEDMIDWEYSKLIESVLEDLRLQNLKIIALEQNEKSHDLSTCEVDEEMFALIVGNEVEGISRVVLDIADEIVEIKMKGQKESLNVSVATGIALYSLLSNQKSPN